MKSGIHPTYLNVRVVCSCGNDFVINSTLSKSTLNIEVCNKCHPFYTGKQKIVDTAGRVDSYYKRFGKIKQI
ncbi:MAG: 50S ribosomal protein L31 [Enterobacteriaceae bacterium]|nr:50S ribosomal protein L31 [Enterobacteriaceae bacterium]